MEERREMYRQYEVEAGGKPRTVKQLMELRKTTPSVLGFIVATWVNQRAQREKRKIRRQERKRDEVWGLEVDRLEGDDNGDAEGEREDRERRREG